MIFIFNVFSFVCCRLTVVARKVFVTVCVLVVPSAVSIDMTSFLDFRVIIHMTFTTKWLCVCTMLGFSYINSHFYPRNSILSVFSIFVCCTLWFVTRNKRAERTVHISTFLQTDWNLYSRRQSCNLGFLWALC